MEKLILQEGSASPKDNPIMPCSRSVEACLHIYQSEGSAQNLTDEEVMALVEKKHIMPYHLEKAVVDGERGVSIR